MITELQAKQLHAIVERLIGGPVTDRVKTLLGANLPPFDVSRPNIHDSKSEFLLEMNTVQSSFDHLAGILRDFIGRGQSDEPDERKMRERLGVATNLIAREYRGRSLETPNDLAIKNMLDTGFFHNFSLIAVDMYIVLEIRLKDLKDQEKQFWNVQNRPPQYYPRIIALRLAKLYANKMRSKPTFGTARDGNHPSTEFGRALQEVFEVLEINGSLRGAATWAIKQLTDEDVNPPVNHLRGLLDLGHSGGAKPKGRNVLEELQKTQEKRL